MEPISFELGSDSYQLLPHTGFQAMDLARKAGGIMTHLMNQGAIQATDGVQNLDAAFFQILSDTLNELSSADYRWIVENTLNRVTVVTPGKKYQALGNVDLIAEHFAGRFTEMYAAMIMVWRLEKFPPFGEASEQDPEATGA